MQYFDFFWWNGCTLTSRIISNWKRVRFISRCYYIRSSSCNDDLYRANSTHNLLFCNRIVWHILLKSAANTTIRGIYLSRFFSPSTCKFNLDERQTTSFIGLPTPANALFWSSLLVAHSTTIETFSFARQLIIAPSFHHFLSISMRTTNGLH